MVFSLWSLVFDHWYEGAKGQRSIGAEGKRRRKKRRMRMREYWNVGMRERSSTH